MKAIELSAKEKWTEKGLWHKTKHYEAKMLPESNLSFYNWLSVFTVNYVWFLDKRVIQHMSDSRKYLTKLTLVKQTSIYIAHWREISPTKSDKK